MTFWHIEAHGEVVEHYSIEADSGEEARELFGRGECGPAYYTEVNGSEIVELEPEDE